MKIPRRLSRWSRAALAVVVSYALVLQALLGAVAASAHAAAGGHGLEILCPAERGADRASPLGSPDAHGQLCCTLACREIGSAAATSTIGSLAQGVETRAALVLPTALEIRDAPAPCLGARAPPLAC
jgi:hypothetical protein